MMAGFIIGVMLGGSASIVLYSLIVSEHINNLEHENAKLIDEMQKVEHELVSYKYIHDNSYIGFDETK